MEAKKILGYRKFNSKAGKPCCVLTVYAPYSDRDISFGACGSKVEDFFIPEECHNLITPQCIGKTAEFTYQISGGRAYVDGVTIK